MIKDLARNLYAGARLSFMLPVGRGEFRTSVDQAFVLLVSGSAMILFIEFASAERNWFPPADRVGFYALAILSGLIGCYAAARLLGVAERLSTLVVMLLAGAFWLVPVFGPVFALADPETLAPNSAAGIVVGLLIVFWFLAIAMRAIHAVSGGDIIKPVVAASIIVVFTTLPKLLLAPPAAWMPEPAKLPQSWTQENLYYGQFGMMERAIDWLGKSRPGVPDVYFVGFGADAAEPVFVNEMREVAQLFENRFDAKGRSVVMINSRTTVRHAPLANLHNLGRTLTEIGTRMDRAEDVLFLYLSAPAVVGGEIAPRFDPLKFVPIPSVDIRRMLDEAEIKYRVIVLSSCAADGFLEPLRGPTTLIVTATGNGQRARGCTGDAAFTAFGKAFFGNALRAGFSIPDAVERARALIAGEEKSARRGVPEPAVYAGSEIAPKLAELATRLETAQAAAATPSVTIPPIHDSRTRKP
jgi:hypothetical protein